MASQDKIMPKIRSLSPASKALLFCFLDEYCVGFYCSNGKFNQIVSVKIMTAKKTRRCKSCEQIVLIH